MAASSSAVVVEKKAAEGRYEKAIDQGDSAIMLERAGDGLCTLNLGNLMAGESATIRYRYAQLLRFEHGSVRLAVPTVIAPRYGDPAVAGLAPHQIPTTDLAVAYPFALTVDLAGDVAQGTLSSPSHAIATERTDGRRARVARLGCLPRPGLRAQRRRARRPFARGGRPRRRVLRRAGELLRRPSAPCRASCRSR